MMEKLKLRLLFVCAIVWLVGGLSVSPAAADTIEPGIEQRCDDHIAARTGKNNQDKLFS